MSIQAGQYAFQPLYYPTLWVGTGPVIAIFPPPSVPLRTLQEDSKDRFDIRPTTGGYYFLKKNDQFVGYNGTDVKLLPLGERGVEWAVVKANGTDAVRLGLPKQNKWWTTSGVESSKASLISVNEELTKAHRPGLSRSN
ncbi:hypothetical protein RhiJN_24048 [Ceratobasidium sp. AG-Ba]|nr:hypothetical protein RhiJN_24048 [Ceratobasidium sp. AG-Ba]